MKKLFFLFLTVSLLSFNGFGQLIGRYFNHSPQQPILGDTLTLSINTDLQTHGVGSTCGNFYQMKDTTINNQLVIDLSFDICYTQSLAWCFRFDTLKIPISQNNLQSARINWNLRGTSCVQFNNYIADSTTLLFGTTALNELENQEKISVSPNPVSELLHLNNTQLFSIQSLQFYNSNGSLVKELPYKNKSIDVTNLAKGFYFLRIKHESGMETIKLIKR